MRLLGKGVRLWVIEVVFNMDAMRNVLFEVDGCTLARFEGSSRVLLTNVTGGRWRALSLDSACDTQV